MLKPVKPLPAPDLIEADKSLFETVLELGPEIATALSSSVHPGVPPSIAGKKKLHFVASKFDEAAIPNHVPLPKLQFVIVDMKSRLYGLSISSAYSTAMSGRSMPAT